MSENNVTEVQPHDELLVIAVLRRTLDEESTSQLVDDVHTLAASKPRVPIVLDLSRVKFAPSVALGSLVHLSKSFQLEGRRVALIGVDDRVRGAIQVTQLHKVLEIHGTIADVLKGPRKP
ncbi:MAG TPA: STAS domain-containing protein [Phycisphaerae bacterium]|nr:STAS domain-containing protein [Phycisphaerae bacterium]